MAEGHAIVRWARGLRPLVGETLVRVDMARRWAGPASTLPGQRIAGVETHGKHLLVSFSGGLTLHCHAMMYGSWQFGRPGQELRKPERQVRVRLRTAAREAVFFNGPIAELLSPRELAEHERLQALGPDLMADAFDAADAFARLRRHAERELGDVVLDQTVVAGIGNIYKSEGLFLAALDPRRPAGSVSRGEADRIWAVTAPLMWQDARRSGPIETLDRQLRRGEERHWVYRRRTRACFRCRTPIEMVRQGELARSTYFCPSCQRGSTGSAPTDNG